MQFTLVRCRCMLLLCSARRTSLHQCTETRATMVAGVHCHQKVCMLKINLVILPLSIISTIKFDTSDMLPFILAHACGFDWMWMLSQWSCTQSLENTHCHKHKWHILHCKFVSHFTSIQEFIQTMQQTNYASHFIVLGLIFYGTSTYSPAKRCRPNTQLPTRADSHKNHVTLTVLQFTFSWTLYGCISLWWYKVLRYVF
jgi:hypothetical protein